MKFVLATSFVRTVDIVQLAVAADTCGWHGISFSDHVVHPETLGTPYPYTKNGERRWPAFTDWPDSQVIIGALATVTKHLHFMNNVFVLPMRNPFLVAKAVATNAVLSNNRVSLCVGLGWSPDEYTLMQQDFHTRGKRCDEAVAVLRKLWQGGWQEHQGEFYSFPKLEMTPVPTESVPIWVGGISEFALKRVARLGDGWVSDLQPAEEILACIARIHEYRRQYGRDHLPFSVMATPKDVFTLEGYRRLYEGGVSHIMLQPWFHYGQSPFTVEQQIAAIERYAAEVIQHCQFNKE